MIEEGFAGAVHTAEIPVIVGPDIFETTEQKVLLYTAQLRIFIEKWRG